MKLLNKIRGDRRSAADIRADVGKVDLAGLAAKVTTIEQERRQFLLNGTDEQLEENARKLAAARLQVERAETLLDELMRLAREAEAREAAEALEAEHAAALKAKETLDRALADAEAVAATLKDHLDKATAAATAIDNWNRRLGPVPVGQPDRRVAHDAPAIVKQRLLGALR